MRQEWNTDSSYERKGNGLLAKRYCKVGIKKCNSIYEWNIFIVIIDDNLWRELNTLTK